MAAHRSGLPSETQDGTRSAQSVRNRIVADARRHFFMHGFRSVTMDDLAAGLAMSKKTLYAHFSSKGALLEAVILDKFAEVDADMGRITSADVSDFPARMHELFACLRQHLGEIQPPFLRDMQREKPEAFAIVETKRREILLKYHRKVLDQGRKAGVIRKDIPVDLIIEILLSMLTIITPQKMEKLGITPETGVMAIIAVVFEGVMTEKGRSRLSRYHGRRTLPENGFFPGPSS